MSRNHNTFQWRGAIVVGVNSFGVFQRLWTSPFQSGIVQCQRSPIEVGGCVLSLIIHLSILCVSRQPLTFFACMIFPVMDSAFSLLFLSTFLFHFLSLQLPTLLSLGAYWHFPANLLSYDHINVCCLIRCAGGLEFHSTSLLTLHHSPWLIHPFFLCSERQAPLYKTPAVLSGRPYDPTVTAVENRGRSSPWEDDNRSKVCVCVYQIERIQWSIYSSTV